MKQSKAQKKLLPFCETYAARCFCLCLLDVENWDEAELAMRNAMLRFRRKGAAKKELVGAWNILAQETLRAAKSFRADRIKSQKISESEDGAARYTGDDANKQLFLKLMSLPQAERDAIGLAYVMGLTRAQICNLLKMEEEALEQALSFAPKEELVACLAHIRPATSSEKLVEALQIGASATPEYHQRSMTAIVAVVMLLNAVGLMVLYRLGIANQPNPDFFGEDQSISFSESSEFTVLYNELLNELTLYEYDTTYYQFESRTMPDEQYPLFEGVDGENTETDVLAERYGYSVASLCGEGYSFAGEVLSATVCRYTKVVIDPETYDTTPTNQEYIVWYDGQADGVNLGQDRIYRIAASTAKFTDVEIEKLTLLDSDVSEIEAKYPGFSATRRYVKYWDEEAQSWEITACVQLVGDAGALPAGVSAQSYAVLEPTGNGDEYRAGAEQTALFFCGDDGEPLNALTEAMFVPLKADGERNPSFYWEYTAERFRLRSVPSMIGMTEDEALAALLEAELQAEVIDEPSAKPAGTVIFCEPKAESAVEFASTVRIYISTGEAEP